MFVWGYIDVTRIGVRRICFWASLVVFSLAVCCGCAEKEAPASGTKIIIATSPDSGATIYLNGEKSGETPLTIESIAPGSYPIQFVKEGYERKVATLEVPDGGEHRIVFKLNPVVGYVTFRSEPPKAAVYLDGAELIGETPLERYPTLLGKHRFELRLADHVPEVIELEVERDFHYQQDYRLEPMKATLNIFSRPAGAGVWLNDERQGKNTPAQFRISLGSYVVGVHIKGYSSSEKIVKIEPNKAYDISFELQVGNAPPGMVYIPAGKFIFGTDGASPDERPRKEIFLEDYYIDRREVTNKAFKEVFPAHGFEIGKEYFPASGITFRQAQQYAKKVGKSLPTEMQWEKAARGSTGKEYPWGPNYNREMCNSMDSFYSTPQRVGSYWDGVSPYGCLDMAGNVYEWTKDWYKAYPGNEDVEKEYGQIFRVLRGGSYLSEFFDLRCATRHFDKMDANQPDYGLRCALNIDRE